MDSQPASNGTQAEKNGRNERSDGSEVTMARIEAMVTEEQVLSDTVARKRRRYTKKRGSSLTRREPTPARSIDEKATSSDEEATTTETPEAPRPKTPERPRRPRRVKSAGRVSSYSDGTPGILTESTTTPAESVSRTDSFKTRSKTRSLDRKKSLTDIAHDEMISLLNKTKRSISSAAKMSRDRFKKVEKTKRSQSAPRQFTEEELLASMRKANLINGKGKPRKYSYGDVPSITQEVYLEINPIVPNTDSILRQRKGQRSEKVIEILDPKTSKVVSRKTLLKPEFQLYHLFSVLQMYTPKEIYTRYRTYKAQMREECKAIRIMLNRCVFELFLIMVYCGIGGMIFRFTEGHFENYYKCGVKRVKRDFLDFLWMKSHSLREDDWKALARSKLRSFEEELHAAHEAGMTTYSGQRSWSFLNGVVYAMTVVTTIGYGHIYPTTTTGQALTIFYSLIGIPLFLIALTDFGKLFTRCIKFLWSFVRRLYYTGSCRKVRKSNQMQEIFKGAQMFYQMATFRRTSADVPPGDVESPPQTAQKTLAEDHKSGAFLTNRSTFTNIAGEDTDTPTTPAISNYEIDDEFNLPISVALFILVAYIFIGALGFCAVEKWNFLTSFYFVYISLSTIGFGDYVPSNPLSTILSIAYLVFGLALMSMCIDVVQTKLKDTFQQASAKLGATIGFEVDETQSITTIEALELPAVHNSIEKKDQTVKNSTETDKNDANGQRDQPNHLASPEESDVGSPNSDMNANTVPVDPS